MRELLYTWVPESQWSSYDRHGYYYKDIHELKARVISINSESCDFHNTYLWAELSDPNDLVAFIQSNLEEAERMDYRAILLGHIPDECTH